VGEGNDWQFPFPNYENGDIFLSWGAVAVKAYADYKPELALKYVKNVLNQHSNDGLAYQRYGRAKQNGLGDDILSGNSLAVVGLYQAIYGINPMYNHFYLDPHITPELAGTELNYNFRGQKLKIGLDVNRYFVANNNFKIISTRHFGFYALGNELSYFEGNNDMASLVAKAGNNITLDIEEWDSAKKSWIQTSTVKSAKNIAYTVNQLSPESFYTIIANEKKIADKKTNAKGSLIFNIKSSNINKIVITKRK
jgi:hypothetical protein